MSSLKFDYGISETRGQRPYQEDSAVIYENIAEDLLEYHSRDQIREGLSLSLFGVFDGHAGEKCSKYCKNFNTFNYCIVIFCFSKREFPRGILFRPPMYV